MDEAGKERRMKGRDQARKHGISELVRNIVEEAEEKAETLLQQARKDAENRRIMVAERCQRRLAEAKEEAERQALAIEEAERKSAEMEVRKLWLSAREATVGAILEEVQARLRESIARPDYGSTLAGWIVEGALGLESGGVRVNTSLAERPLLDDALRKARAKLLETFGRSVRLAPSEDPPLLAQGVTLASEDRNTAYDNRVATRIRRHQTAIRKIIYRELFEE